MYTSFFGLNEKPFSITPDPRYLFMSERHAEGLAHLLYGVRETGGFIQLTGEVGTGKTTLVRSLLQQIPETTDVALILNPQLSRVEFLSAICEELGVPMPADHHSIKSLTNALNAFLLRNHGRGRHTILIVDEAQNLKVDVLEQVRLLTNLETTKQKLLQIILIGQPELRELLSRTEMRQLAQRITGRYHLEPLSRDDADAYIEHRLKVAGAVGEIIDKRARRELFRQSAGVPRMINVIADRALLGAFTREQHKVTAELVKSAAREVFDRKFMQSRPWLRWAAAAAIGATVVAAGIWGLQQLDRPEPPAAAVATSAPPVLEPAPPMPGGDPVTAAQAAPEPEKLTQILAAAAEATGTDSAFASLFRLWGHEYRRGPVGACKQAEAYQLFCLFQRGSLSQVRGLDRPVILTLRDLDSVQHQVVLSGLDDREATVTIGDSDHRISVNDLENFWFGEYLLLWRPESGEVKSYFPGMRDPDVKWIRESLAAIQGRPATPMGSDLFDEALAERVREYQRDRRLTVDGLVGQQTQIAMNTDLGAADRPRLVRVN
ncbi:MAG: AAA family ATPase [Gammaproteobacteria bacterium]|nr:AAA family ATPase [Gammaproteobacteria bacterium]